jgi:sterol desaturase/sphingolipid hydroxylase (fatty acid hydroxylase superfamily)
MVAAIVIASIGLPLLGVVVHSLAGYALATFHHSNVRLPRWLERALAPVIITPEVHFPHHHELKRDTNSNFGFIFPWWDKLFGTFNRRRRTPDWRMGLDYSPDLPCIALLREPFRPEPLWVRRADPGPSPGRAASPQGPSETPKAGLLES